ncbi:MFS transporter [Undibacterium flavidum]|uniref:MFS transporter n=1 Tax=Undibacterium flavidum TaxID=2762297 RepID=A0ABR6Y780_9BURK|nr:MFS transporter [Undibacterium flavidum]MBC3872471.1 MFS transporter [Undibacterium flavidum]
MNNNSEPARGFMRDRNFLWMLTGAITSMLGDQFTLIALPWLVLQMSHDTFTLGIVLALLGIPRALFMLIGGAVVDRYDPKSVMMITKYINTALLAILVVLLMTSCLSLWMIYLIALLLGLSTAFSIPAGTSMLPRVVAAEHLQAANGMMLGLRQITFFLGPLMAGGLIALLGDHATASQAGQAGLATTLHAANMMDIADKKGLAMAFFVDCFSYGFSAWTLSHVNMLDIKTDQQTSASKQSLLSATMSGLRHCWNDTMMRTCFLYWSAIAFLIMGPMQIAMPLLAQQLGNSAGVLGLLAGAHGAGTLLGMAMSSVFPKLRLGSLGSTILLIDTLVALLFMPMGLIHVAWQGAAILLAIGALGGYLHVAVFTWIQRQVPPAMLGRAMSIFMFIFMGISPVSAALTGWLMHSLSLTQLFTGSGALLIVIVAIALLMSPIRQMRDAGRAI